ncbi:hypothetical protein PCANC_21866, partial [Puccinia coronata f. sp. avenae]
FVLYLGVQAILQVERDTVPLYDSTCSSAVIYKQLISEVEPEAAIQQLRWTNSHTLWYSSLLIDTFRSTESEVVKEQVARVFLERLLVQRPHPFGMIYAFIKFLSQCGSASQLNHHHHQHQHQNENGNPSLDADDRELRSISSLESLKVVKKSQELKALFSICRKHVVQIN